MKNKKWMAILLGGIMAASLAAPCSVSAADKTTITFWHAMGGTNGEVLQQIVDDFNASQDEIEIKAEYQGTYDDTITKLKAAMQSDSGLPDVCQMYDVGTKFMYDSGSVIPVEDKFESTGYDKSSVMDVISSYYTVDGKQYAMPFNVSTPILLSGMVLTLFRKRNSLARIQRLLSGRSSNPDHTKYRPIVCVWVF